MTIDNELIDNLLKDYKKPADLIGENGLLKQLTKQLLERAMAAEMTEHVGYDKHDAKGNNSPIVIRRKTARFHCIYQFIYQILITASTI